VLEILLRQAKMDSKLWIFIAVDVVLALLIALYQKQKGYKFINTFISSLIGLVGLSAMLYKALYL
tara:strand:- start:89 stop:283 length:195 start_codon:yes stop_codon:yes gene_type:complete